MNTTDTNNLRAFYSVLNRQHLNRDVFNFLLKRWELDGIDLDLENERIKNKISKLSKSKRAAVPEFLIIRSVLNEIEKSNNENKDSHEEINFN